MSLQQSGLGVLGAFTSIKNYDMLLALLPFEPSYFQRVGLQCQYVGHPVLEYGADQGDGIAFRLRHGISEKLLCFVCCLVQEKVRHGGWRQFLVLS